MVDALMLPAALASEPTASSSGRRAPRGPMNEHDFEQFYRKNARDLWAYIFRLTGDAAAADDLLQKAFFRFLRSNPTIDSDEHLRRYLFRTATNLAMDHFRETKKSREQELVPESATVPAPGDLRHDMRRLFTELKPRERALLWLAHVEEADHAEIGIALGVKAKSVKVLLFRARKRLGELLTRNGIGPGVTS